MLRLNTYLILLCAVITGTFTAVFSLRARDTLNSSFERVRDVQEASVESLVRAQLDAHLFVLSRDREEIERDSEIAKAILLRSRHGATRPLSAKLLELRKRFQCDFVGAIDSDKSVFGIDLDQAGVGQPGFDNIALVYGRVALVAKAKAQWVSETVGFVVFGYFLNETLAPEIFKSTNVRVTFANPRSPKPEAQAHEVRFGDAGAVVRFGIKDSFISQVRSASEGTILLSGVVSFLAIALLIYILLNRGFLRGFHELLECVRRAGDALEEGIVENIKIRRRAIREINDLSYVFETYTKSLASFSAKIRSKSRNELLGEVSAQIAHDMNGAINALELAVDPANGDRFSQREGKQLESLFGRLRAITTGVKRELKLAEFSEPGNGRAASIFVSDEPYSKEQLLPLVEEVVAEKSLEAERINKGPVLLSGWEEAFSSFSKIQKHEFQRVLANLIDNAIDASNGHEAIFVELDGQKDRVFVRVRDAGTGISPDLISKLGMRGFTSGKSNGSGLGLWHAKEVVNHWDGEISIESQLGSGTTVEVSLRAVPPPKWFVPSISLAGVSEILVLDDETYVHAVLRERFGDFLKGSRCTLNCFTEAGKLLAHFHRNSAREQTLVLCDFDLRGEWTGLEVIEELRDAPRKILITHHADQSELRAACEQLGVGLLSKTNLTSIPILMSSSVARHRRGGRQ